MIRPSRDPSSFLQASRDYSGLAGSDGTKKSDILPIDPVPGPPAAPRIAFKLWAELVGPDGEGRRDYVNLTSYRWEPGERFRLWIKPAVALQFGLFDAGPLARGDEKVAWLWPKGGGDAAGLVPAGQSTSLPLLLRLDNTASDEQLGFVAVLPGTGRLSKDVSLLFRSKEDADRRLETLKSVLSDVSRGLGRPRFRAFESGQVGPSKSFDDVATILFGDAEGGVAVLEVLKSRP
jgi:hypothetical protein